MFTSPFFWKVAPVAVLSQASFISIQSLWAGPWLRDVGGLSRDDAAAVLLLIAAAMMGGFLGMGLLAERLGRLGIGSTRVSAGGMLAFILIQGAIVLNPPAAWLTTAWILFGFFGTSGIIQYAALSQHFPRQLSGRVNTSINLLVFITAFILQWLIGAIIDLWPQTIGGAYSEAGYRAAFGTLLTLQATALIWYLIPDKKV